MSPSGTRQPTSQRFPLYIVWLSTHTLYGVLSAKTKTYLIPLPWSTLFLFFSFFFSKLEHLIFKFGLHHHNDHHLAPPLGMGPSFHVYTLSTRISPKVSSIIQNQTRAFNLPLFVIDDNLFTMKFNEIFLDSCCLPKHFTMCKGYGQVS